jgi:hypothetical protein
VVQVIASTQAAQQAARSIQLVEVCKTDLEVSAMLDRCKLFSKETEIETIQLRHNDLVGSGNQGPVRSQRQPCEHARLHG